MESGSLLIGGAWVDAQGGARRRGLAGSRRVLGVPSAAVAPVAGLAVVGFVVLMLMQRHRVRAEAGQRLLGRVELSHVRGAGSWLHGLDGPAQPRQTGQ